MDLFKISKNGLKLIEQEQQQKIYMISVLCMYLYN